MDIHVLPKGDAIMITLSGRLDTDTADSLEQEFNKQLQAGHKNFILDLGNLQYISSYGLRSILMLAKQLREKDGKLLLHNLGGEVKEVFDISGFSALTLKSGSWVKKD